MLKIVRSLRLTYIVVLSLMFIVVGGGVLNAQERISLVLETPGGLVLYENRPITLNINGRSLPMPESDMPPIILQDRTFVPVRHVFEAMGAVVDFHPAWQRIMIAHEGNLIVMHIGEYHFNLDNAIFQMDVAPQIINERTMVPVSFVAAAMGFVVDWDESTFTVNLTSQDDDDDEPARDNGHYYDDIDCEGGRHNQDTGANFAELSIDLSPGPIPGETNLETSVTGIIWTNDFSQFIISANSRISMVDWLMLPDGRLIVDIVHSRLSLPQNSFNVNSGFITTIRTGHNIIEGINVARVVFDLAGPVIYSVTLSHDRQHVMVSFEHNVITNIDFVGNYAETGAWRESIIISGVVSPQLDIFSLFDPHRLVIDLPNSALGFQGNIPSDVNGRFVRYIRHSQFTPTTSRVVVDLANSASFTVERTENAAIIHLSDPTYRNIRFNSDTGMFEIRKPYGGLNASQIVASDRYLEWQYILTLPGDFAGFFGYGRYMAWDDVVHSMDIVTENGQTRLIINTNRIMAFVVTEDSETIFVRPVEPREKYPRIVLIDPGHGGRYPGASHHGMREADVALDVALMVMEILNRDGLVRAYATRYTDITVSNAHRAVMANQIADIFVSIHFNASLNRRAQGTEVLYAIHDRERALAFNSQHMAQIFQTNLVDALGSVNRGIRYRPDIQILNSTYIPAVLLEVGFLDNAEEAARIATQAYRILAAQAIVDSIYETFGIFTPRR